MSCEIEDFYHHTVPTFFRSIYSVQSNGLRYAVEI